MSSCSGWLMLGMAAKNSTASSTSICSTSPMLLPRQVTASVSGLKRAPWQASQGTFTSGRKLMPMVRTPCAFAGRAAALAGVEARSAPARSRAPRLQRVGEQLADRVPEADVGGRAGARRLADRRLVHFQHAVDRLVAVDARCSRPRPGACPRHRRRGPPWSCAAARPPARCAAARRAPASTCPSRERRSPRPGGCSGTSTSTSCRLCRSAPRTVSQPVRAWFGSGPPARRGFTGCFMACSR